MRKIFYIDPMSYANMATYDYSLLSQVTDYKIFFFGNVEYEERKLKQRIVFIPIFKYSHYKTNISKFFSYAYSMLIIAKHVIITKPRIVHVQWFKMPTIDMFFCKILKKKRIKLIYTVHNILPHDSGNKEFKKYNKYYKYADKLIVHTQKTKDELVVKMGVLSSKVVVIPHGILQIDANAKEVSRLQSLLLDKPKFQNKVIFSLLGVQSRYKGGDMIIKLWSEEIEFRENMDYLLLIMGRNINLDYSPLKGIKNVYIIERYISNEEFLAALRITNVLLMPYTRISQSGLLMSAISEKVPFLVSSAGALEKPLELGKVGWSIGKPTYKNLKMKLTKILYDGKEIIEVKQNLPAWETVQKNYSWVKSGKLTSELYAQTLKE